jgi:site-specific recombinase XerD
MTTLPAVQDSGSLPLAALPEMEGAVKYALAEKAEATRRAYKSDFAIFRAWCSGKGLSALPTSPEAVAAFLASEAVRNVKPSTLGRRLAAIRYSHRLAGLPSPSDAEPVRATLRGIKRVHGAAPVRKAAALSTHVKAMVAHCDAALSGRRDRALLLLGFASACRRSELAGLNVEDLEFCGDLGVKLTIRKSKTDQEARGRVVAVARGIEACPVRALQDWLSGAGIERGPVFRPIGKGNRIGQKALTDRSIANIVKAYAGRAGFDPEKFAGHSLRRGFLTAGANAGKGLFKLMAQSGHRSVETVRTYIQDSELFKDNASAGLL